MDIRSFFGKGGGGGKSKSKESPQVKRMSKKRTSAVLAEDSDPVDDPPKSSVKRRTIDATAESHHQDNERDRTSTCRSPRMERGKRIRPSRNEELKRALVGNATVKNGVPEKETKKSKIDDSEETTHQESSCKGNACEVEPKKTVGYRSYMQRSGPSAPGSKEIPAGKDGCLFGKVFVVTGVLDSLEREEVHDLIKKYGGQIVKSVAKKTTHAVVGRDAGVKKLEQIQQRGIIRLSEDDLFDMIRSSAGHNLSEKEKEKIFGYKLQVQPVSAAPCIPVSPNCSSSKKQTRDDLWTDKFRPIASGDLVGNPGVIKKMKDWLSTWQVTFGKHRQPAKKDHFKAVLLSGPPGIGKTSSAHVIAKEVGYEAVEFNASDTRSKNALHDNVMAMVGNRSLNEFWVARPKGTEPTTQRTVLIMDEVDGMSGGDRGGMRELISMIKKTQIPIICVCNDRQSEKVRSLRNHCLELQFRRPEPRQVMARLLGIARAEHINVEHTVLEKIAKASQGDIRQMLNTLQLLKNKEIASDKLTDTEVNERIRHSGKDVSVGLFDALPGIFLGQNYATRTMDEKMDLYFVDHALVPLMVQENYASATPVIPGNLTGARKELAVLSRVCNAARSISDGDLVEAEIRSSMNWKLLPTHAILSTVRPAFFMRGGFGRQNFPQFLGKLSTTNKNYRILRELASHLRVRLSVDGLAMRLDYLEIMSQRLTAPLHLKGQDGLDEVLQFMDTYGISKDDWDALMDLVHVNSRQSSLVKDIPSAVKSALTRRYNSSAHAITVAQRPMKSLSRGITALAIGDEEEEEAGNSELIDAAATEDANDDDEMDLKGDKMIKAKHRRGKEAKEKGSSSRRERKGSRGKREEE